MPYNPVLADVDDTLIDSTAIQAWGWAKWASLHDLDPEPFISAHGLRIQEKLEALAPHLPATEAERIVAIAATCPLSAKALPGAERLLRVTTRIALVTSGTRDVVLPQLERAGLVPPKIVVSADDVRRGKPDPEPYLMAARLLRVPASGCIVLEDAPAGVAAGVAAGMTVVAVTTTSDPSALFEAGARFVVPNVAAYLRLSEGGTITASRHRDRG